VLSVQADAADDSRNFVTVFMITSIIKTNEVALRISKDSFPPKNSRSGFQAREIGEKKI